ncbi:hypothetical protein [Actinophytocola sp. KF-1]
MVTRDAVAAWARRVHNLTDADERIHEGPHSFVLHLAPPGNYGGATAVVSRRTGEYWLVPSYANVHGLAGAGSEDELRAAVAAHAERPDGTIAPPVTHEQVTSWLAERGAWRHLDSRVTDLGWMFLVNTQPDDFLDGTGPQDPAAGPIVVEKGGGAVWRLPLSPHLTRLLGVRDTREFRQELARAGLPADPDEWLPEPPKPEVTRERVAAWFAAKYGWRHRDDRVTDRGWMFSVNTQPDEYLDGDESAMTFGNGPVYVIKRTGAMWFLPSHPGMIPVFEARDEQDFRRLMRAVDPFFDPDRPTDWLRP